MSLDRRECLTTSSLALAAGALGVRPLGLLGQQAPPQVTFRELRGGVGIATARGGTLGWYVSPDAVVVVDSQFPDTAQAFVTALRQRTQRPVDALINTHHHGDHTGGNGVFRQTAKMIVAHERVPDLMRQQAEAAAANTPPPTLPDVTFGETWRQAFGRENIRARHYGPAHTGGDAMIFFENANVVHLGDVGFNERHPFVDRPAGASIKGWHAVLEKTVADHGADTLYIFGHAKEGMDVTGPRATVLRLRDYFSAVLERVDRGVRAGQSKEQVAALTSLRGFEGFAEQPPRLTLAGVLGIAYDELSQ